MITWVYDDTGFNPAAKLQGNKSYSVINDYLGTPLQAYDEKGALIWNCQLDIYGKVEQLKGDKCFIPFRYQGQYFDSEVDLCYNRFRYYDPNTGTYISQDPIGLSGGIRLYSYVFNSNTFIDVFGLMANFPTDVDFSGSPDLFPHENAIIKIKMQGSRGRDFTEAFKKSGIDRKLAGDYTWHHMYDFDPKTGETTMQLIKTDTHKATIPHKGSVDQFIKYFEIDEYSKKGGAVDIAIEKGWVKYK